VKFIDDVFGLNIEESTPDISDELKEKIEERFKAKKAKDFAKADALRDEILADGITLLDGAEKSTWQYK
jgi:cysteinyl-tRNA synthetase